MGIVFRCRVAYGEGGHEENFIVLSPFQYIVPTIDYEPGNDIFKQMEEYVRKIYNNEKLILKSLSAQPMIENKSEIQ